MQKPFIEEYDKIGGWLILVMIGFFVTPIKIVSSLGTDFLPLFMNGTWKFLLTDPFVKNGIALAVFIVFEILVNIGLVAFSIFLLFQMRDKSPSLPRNAIVFYSSGLFFGLLDLAVYSHFFQSFEDSGMSLYSDLIRSIISAAIWIPYFLHSKRVKETFKIRPEFSSEVPAAVQTDKPEEQSQEETANR